MKRIVLTSIFILSLPASNLLAADSEQALFTIERSKNANVVQYDARVSSDGKLEKKNPVVAYWIRHTEQGQRAELTWVQRTFAYGFDTRLSRDRETAELKLKADLGRVILVRKEESKYRAQAVIDGTPAFIQRIFIHSTGKGMATNVEYMDLFGTAIEDGAEKFERIQP
jgi:hypothetical protein